jgi:hypothetical protein
MENADVLAHMENSDPAQALAQFIALLPNLDMSA